MEKLLKFHVVLLMLMSCLFSCAKEPVVEQNEEVIEVDSFKYLTPCLKEIATNYRSYVMNDNDTHNDNYNLESILRLKVDSVNYYWLRTDWEDETEYILNDDCEIFCIYTGWFGFSYDVNCLHEFSSSIWTRLWPI